jgi:hypothetical protein
MKSTQDEYGDTYYELPTLDTTKAGLEGAAKKMQRMLIRPRSVRRVK